MNKKAWLLALFAYLLTRLYNLMSLPIFNDEAFFLWAGRQIVSNPVKNLFLNFSDGKEPLFFWLYTLPVKFSPDALLGIRLFTVILGFFTLVYLLKISQKLSLNSFWVGLAYLVSPFLLFYHRVAMQETLLTFLLVAAIYYFLTNSRILIGVFLGLALLTKTSALALSIFFLPILIYRKNFLTLIIAGLVFSPVILGFSQVTNHNSSYFGLISLSQIFVNLKMAARWLWEYQGPLGLLGMLMPPVILESLVAKIFFPRYFLFVVPFLILLVVKIFQKKPWILFLLLIPNVFLSWGIIVDIKQAPLPYIERWQYLESWPSGDGIKETAEFLVLKKAQTVVVEEGIMITQFGLPYYYSTANYVVNQVGDYYVFDKEQNNFPDNFTLEYSYLKTGGKEKIRVFRKI